MKPIRCFGSALALCVCTGSLSATHVAFSPSSGPIPDGFGTTPDGSFAPALTLSAGTNSTSTVKDVVLSVSLNVAKAGALRVRLSYTPLGGTATEVIVFNRLGAVAVNQQGDLSPMPSAYVFIDSTGSLWTAATNATGNNPVLGGVYTPATNTLNGSQMNIFFSTAFGGKPGRGTWRVSFDKCWFTNTSDTVTGATITVNFNPPPTCIGDLDNNGVINTADLTIFLGQFGRACP